MNAGRAVGIDLGTRRIGVAVTDSGRRLASPYAVIERTGDPSRDHDRLRRLCEELEATVLVVGLPISLDGTLGQAARAAREEIEALRGVVGLPVETVDERLTTVEAHRHLQAAGKPEKKRRQEVDKVAAALLLQAWVDRTGGDAPDSDVVAP